MASRLRRPPVPVGLQCPADAWPEPGTTCLDRPALGGAERSCFNRPTVKITMTTMRERT